MRPNVPAYVLLVGALIGLWFSAVSTFDFVAHLDRQVHGIHCSFLPGLATPEVGGGGCQVTLMSPYSSVLRQAVWGGIPISLPAMSVFAFLAFWAVWLIVRDREGDTRVAGFTLLATSLPLMASLVMGYVSLVSLDTVCKQCIGIYTASLLSFGAAVVLFLRARSAPPPADGGVTLPALGIAFGLGVLCVALPFGAYAASAPDFSKYVGACGQLEAPDDPNNVLVPIGGAASATTMIEVLDPLCPSCRGFEDRFEKIEAAETIQRKALLFPLDNACNWMVNDAIHPGACAISEAVLCASTSAESVLEWAFENQEAIVAAERAKAGAAASMAREKFPTIARCIGSPSARAKLNLALRYAVKNKLHVLTPQVYVQGLRLCDEDTDLGLEYALPRLIARASSMPPRPPAPPLPAAPPPMPVAARPVRPRPAVAPEPAAVPDAPQGAAEALDEPTAQPPAEPPAEPTTAPSVEPPAPPEPEGEAP
jgi:uncharacterized membrane protein